MQGKLSENRKDYDKWQVFDDLPARSIAPGVVAIRAPAGWWVLRYGEGSYRFQRKPFDLGKTDYDRIVLAIRSGNVCAVKFRSFALLIRALNRQGGAE